MTQPPLDIDSLRLTPLPGSERSPATGVESADGSLDAASPIEVTLVLRRRAELPDPARSPRLSRSDFAALYGADPSDIETVTQIMTGLGLAVLEADPFSRRVRVGGPAGLLSRVFGVALSRATGTAADGSQVSFRQRTGGLSIPAQLAGIVTAVLGLDDRPQARMLSRVAEPGP